VIIQNYTGMRVEVYPFGKDIDFVAAKGVITGHSPFGENLYLVLRDDGIEWYYNHEQLVKSN